MQHSVADISVNAEVDITREQIKKLPTDDIWWTVYGEDMLWNFKNLNKIFPTNTVYRNGPVKNLPLNISKSIANTKIQTPKGPMAFESFLHSDLSTAISLKNTTKCSGVVQMKTCCLLCGVSQLNVKSHR